MISVFAESVAKDHLLCSYIDGIIVLQYTPLLGFILDRLYPQIRRIHYKSEMVLHDKRQWKDPYPYTVSRSLQNPGKRDHITLLWIFAVMWGLLVGAFIIDWQPDQIALLVFLSFTLLVAAFCVVLFMGNSGDVLHFSDQDITVTRGKKERTVAKLLANEIRTVAVYRDEGRSYYDSGRIFIFSKTEEELAQEEARRLRKTAFGTRQLEGIMQLPGWQRMLAIERVRHSYGFCEKLWLYYTPQRAETLKQLYPQAVWIEKA